MILTKNAQKHLTPFFPQYEVVIIDQKISIFPLQIKDQIPSNHNIISTMDKGPKKKSGKKIEPEVDPNETAFPELSYPTIIDLTKDSRPAKQLLQAAKDLRDIILTRRKDKLLSRSLTYEVKSSSFTVKGVKGHHELAKKPNSKQPHKKKIAVEQGDKIFFKDEIINARLTISTDDIYPQSMGYAFIQKNEQQCYHIWINGHPYTLIEINYPKDGVEQFTKLSDVLGILIAEQIRFNTLDLYYKAFPEIEMLSTFDLYKSVYNNFKVPIYNGWQHKWDLQLSQKLMLKAFEFEIGWKLQQAQRVNFRNSNNYTNFIASLDSYDQFQRIYRQIQWKKKEDQYIYGWMEGKNYESQINELVKQAKLVESQRIFNIKNEKVEEVSFIHGNRVLKKSEIKKINEERENELQLLKAEAIREFEMVVAKIKEITRNLYVEKLVKHRGQPNTF